MRRAPWVLIALCIATLVWAADIPKRAEGPKARHDRAIEAAQRVYNEAILNAKTVYLKDITSGLTDATKAGNLDEANALNALKKEIETEIARLRIEESRTIIKAEQAATIFAASCPNGEIRINGEKVAEMYRDKATKANVTLREGDVIAVHIVNRHDINSFWLVALSSDRRLLFETNPDTWTSYNPSDESRWWEVKGTKAINERAEWAPDKREYLDLVKKAAASVYEKPNAPIAATVNVGGASYLAHLVTRGDLTPKR